MLVEDVRRLHAAGTLHRSISVESVSIDGSNRVVLAPPEESRSFGGPFPDDDVCPPELRRERILELPGSLTAAQRVLSDAGVSLNAVEIDVYQVGTLLCRLITGEQVASYLRSPRTKGKVPADLQPLIERALGFEGGGRFADVHEFAAAVKQALSQMQSTEAIDAKQADQPRPKPSSDTAPSVISAQPEPETSTDTARESGPGDELPFRKLDHYEIVERIGHGGMGDVYKGYEPALDRTVAVKVLPAEFARQDDFVRRFYAEAAAAAKLVHPNTVEIHYIGEDAGHHFFVMQYIDGESLAELLDRHWIRWPIRPTVVTLFSVGRRWGGKPGSCDFGTYKQVGKCAALTDTCRTCNAWPSLRTVVGCFRGG